MAMGLLGGFDDPKTLGLLGMAAPLLQAGGYSQTPVSLGQALGAGMQGGVQGYQGGLQNQQAAKLRAMQMAQMERAAQQQEKLGTGMDAYFAKPPGAPTMANAALKSPAEQAGMTPQMISFAQSLPPEQRAAFVQSHLGREAKETIVPAGGTLVRNGQPVYTNPRSERPSSFESAMQASGLKPGTPEYQQAARAYVQRLGTAPSTTVTVDQKQDTAEAGGYGTALIDEYKTVRDRGIAANDARSQLSIARAINAVGPDGKELPSALQMQVGNAATALGINPESPAAKALLGRVTDGQAFVGTMQNLVLTKMQAQKGPQTETDAKRIESTVSSLGNTPQTREFLLRSADALAQLDQMQAQFWDEYRAKNPKKSFEGASSAWREWRNKTPLIGTNPNTNLPVFLPEFMDAARRANPDATEDQIIGQWRMKYGRK